MRPFAKRTRSRAALFMILLMLPVVEVMYFFGGARAAFIGTGPALGQLCYQVLWPAGWRRYQEQAERERPANPFPFAVGLSLLVAANLVPVAVYLAAAPTWGTLTARIAGASAVVLTWVPLIVWLHRRSRPAADAPLP